MPMPSKAPAMVGKPYHRLTVLAVTDQRIGRSPAVECRCECGAVVVRCSRKVRHGEIKSCGCLPSDRMTALNTTHGGTGSPEYRSWRAMITRCEDEKHEAHHRYAGRGIVVCDRWRESFEAFLADMGPRPSLDHSIERKDNDGIYEPGNCRWATRTEQAENRRGLRLVEFRGETRSVGAWSRILGIPYHRLSRRVRRGWDMDRAVTQP